MTKVKKLAVEFALVGAIAALVGIFLPWLSYEGAFSISFSGWEVLHQSDLERSFLFQMGKSFSDDDALIVFIAAIVMLVCALLAAFLSFKAKIASVAVRRFDVMISLTSAAVIFGLLWFLIDMGGTSGGWHIGDGVYVCGGGALVGLFCGLLVSAKE